MMTTRRPSGCVGTIARPGRVRGRVRRPRRPCDIVRRGEGGGWSATTGRLRRPWSQPASLFPTASPRGRGRAVRPSRARPCPKTPAGWSDDLLRSVDTVSAGRLACRASAPSPAEVRPASRATGHVDLAVELELLDQRGLVAQGGNDEVPVPLGHAGIARVGHSHGRQIVVMNQGPVTLDGDLAPEVIDPTGRSRGVLEENLGLSTTEGKNAGGSLASAW